MRVDINGMGRIGRLARRASLGAVDRLRDDRRAGNRLDIIDVNEVRGGAEATAHFDRVRQPARSLAPKFAAKDDHAIVSAIDGLASARRVGQVMCRGAISAATLFRNAQGNF